MSLDELRALEQAATPAPWKSEAGDVSGVTEDGSYLELHDDFFHSEADADLIVAARNALPDLLGRVAAAEAERDRWKEQSFRPLGDNHHNAALCPYCGALLARAEAERDALRAIEAVARAYVEAELAHDEALGLCLDTESDPDANERARDAAKEAGHRLDGAFDALCAVLAASVPSGPAAAGPTTSKETR